MGAPSDVLVTMMAEAGPALLSSGQFEEMATSVVTMLLAPFAGKLWTDALEVLIEVLAAIGADHDRGEDGDGEPS